MDLLDKTIILKELGKSLFSKNIIIHERIGSTNVSAKELAAKGMPEGTVIAAEEQTAGRGRMDRNWLSPSHENLLFSIILRPLMPAEKVFALTMIFSVAIIEAIQETTGLKPMIKWPNDIYMNKKKLGGILTEFSLKGQITDYVILGLGLNVNWMPEKESDILFVPTSILKETGKRTSRNIMLVEILTRFESYYQAVISGSTDRLHSRWNSLSLVTGRKVVISGHNTKTEGIALGIDSRGALILRLSDGHEEKIISGDVSLRF